MNSVVSLDEKVERLKACLALIPPIEIPTQHWLFDGIYVRQISIRRGTLLVGRKHKKFHLFAVLKGSIAVTANEAIRVLVAGDILLGSPGKQRVGIAAEDCLIITIHRTEATVLKDIEEDLTEYDPSSRYGVGNEVLPELLEAL